MRDQGSQSKGGWVCQRPAGVSEQGWVGGHMRDQGSHANGRWVCERPGGLRPMVGLVERKRQAWVEECEKLKCVITTLMLLYTNMAPMTSHKNSLRVLKNKTKIGN